MNETLDPSEQLSVAHFRHPLQRILQNHQLGQAAAERERAQEPAAAVDNAVEVPSDLDSKVQQMRGILGDSFAVDKIKSCLLGADGNVEIALNHILNSNVVEEKIVKEDKNQISKSSSGFSLSSIPNTDKLLYELAEEVKCPLCLSYFVNPVLLSCFHTFCSSCIEEVVSDKTVSCPLCRASTMMDERGVRGLKSNYYLANIVEKLKSAQNTKTCDECRSTICTVVCKQCKAFLCESCNDKVHSLRLLHNHHRVPFDECFFTSNRSMPVGLEGLEFEINWEKDSVIPFNVKKEVCIDLFHSWVKELWFAPSDLIQNAILQEFTMVYIPYWLFEVDTMSKYAVTYSDKLLGERCEYGALSKKHNDIMVCASTCPEALLLSQIEPWKIDQITNFTLKHTEGAEIKPFTIDAETLWRGMAKQQIDQLNRDACRQQLRYRIRTDTITRMHMDTGFANKKTRRIWVPVYSTTYEYRGKTYHFIVNGATAKAFGNRPYSISKLGSMGLGGFISAIGLLSSARFK